MTPFSFPIRTPWSEIPRAMNAQDLYADVTNRIVKALESSSLPPWRRPWVGGGGFLPLRHNGIPYRGINTLILMMESDSKGYASPYFFTFRQARELGGSVKAGEKSTPILFCQPMTKKETAEDGEEAEARFWLSKVYRVFCADQCQDLPERFTVKAAHQLDPSQRIEHADAYARNTGADVRHLEAMAYYRPSGDYVNMPAFELFDEPEAYYSTLCHELAHWTGAKHRLDRLDAEKRTREDYSREEIYAELASCLVCAQLGIAPPTLDQHAAYLDHWLSAMRQDSKYIFTAAATAQRIVDYLNSLQPSEVTQ
jgi:antirestriction protein ArdC